MTVHMNEVLETQAKIVAEELLLQGKSEAQTVRLLGRPQPNGDNPWPGISKPQALAVIAAVKQEWLDAAEPARDELRAAQRRRLLYLYNAAFQAKRFTVCVQCERLLAELDGTLAPRKLDHRGMPGGTPIPDDEFEERSQLECEHFAAHGRWPEEGQVH